MGKNKKKMQETVKKEVGEKKKRKREEEMEALFVLISPSFPSLLLTIQHNTKQSKKTAHQITRCGCGMERKRYVYDDDNEHDDSF